ncbi:MAG: Ig-like domain-containing protein [Muribaculaceae bacterium]|nr:Ig-like domain-containing protein [Muribaculaceae bacterium]
MKKLLLSAVVALAGFSVANADEVTFDFTANSYDFPVETETSAPYLESGSMSEGVVTVTINKNNGSGARFWATQAGAKTFRIMNKSGITVSVEGCTITEMKLTGTNTGYFSASEGTYTSGTWTGNAESIELTNVGTTNASTGKVTTGTIQIKTLVVTYSNTSDTRKDAELAFPEEKYTVTLGEEFTAPVLSKATNAEVTYSSDKTSVATVDAATGAVTVVGVGTARITATAAANDEFKSGSASYLLTVNWAAPVKAAWQSELGAEFTLENPEEYAIWKQNNYGLVGSGFYNSVPNAATAIAVSPVIDLTTYKKLQLHFSNAFNQYKENNVMIDPDNFDPAWAQVLARVEGETEWTVLNGLDLPEAFSWNFYENSPIDLSAFDNKNIQIAFRYTSTEAIAGTWEVQHIYITGDNSDAVESIVADENAPVEFFNLQGIRVANPENGIFIRRQGNKVSKVIL